MKRCRRASTVNLLDVAFPLALRDGADRQQSRQLAILDFRAETRVIAEACRSSSPWALHN